MSLNGPSSRRTTATWTIVVVVAVVAAALAVGATAAYFELKSSGGSGTSAAGSTVNITDDLGRHVSVPSNVSRVVALAPSVLDSLVRLGLRADVVGVDCDALAGGLSADYNSSQIAQWGLTSSMCVDLLPAINSEELLNKSPQLIVASTLSPVATLEEDSATYGIPLVILAPTTIGGILVDVDLLGQVFHVPGQAGQLLGELQGVLALAQNVSTNLTDSGTPLPTVLLTYYANPAATSSPGYFTYGPSTFGQSLLELASGASISANATLSYPELSGSQVLLADPQFIIYGTGFGLDLSTYQQGPDWSEFPAVTNHGDFGIDSNYITEADPSMILVGVPLLLHLLHPDLVPA